MDFVNQQEAIVTLNSFAEAKRQAVLISGPEGCGKTYLAKHYSKLLHISDFHYIEAKVASIREAADMCSVMDTPIVLCIENLDTGVDGAAYALLKFLEEPKQNVYIIVTCRNIRQVPDTILSRCTTLTVPPMLSADIKQYVITHDATLSAKLNAVPELWPCLRSIADATTLSKVSAENIGYFRAILSKMSAKDSVSSIIWKLQRFPDNTYTPIHIVIRYLMNTNALWRKPCIDCLDRLSFGRLGTHAVIARLVFDLKYGGML